MSMGYIDFMEHVIRDAIHGATTNQDISDLIGVLETTHLDALDKREQIKEIE